MTLTERFYAIEYENMQPCDACGHPFSDKEWQSRHTHHEPGCPSAATDNDPDLVCDPCDCDLNYHGRCCPVCNAPHDDPFTDMSQSSILERVRAGSTTGEDADRLFRWLNPPKQERVVHAYLTLICDADAAREFIALDLREGLSRRLLEDAPRKATYVPVQDEQMECACPDECGIMLRIYENILYLVVDGNSEAFYLPDNYRLCRVEKGGENLAQTRKLE